MARVKVELNSHHHYLIFTGKNLQVKHGSSWSFIMPMMFMMHFTLNMGLSTCDFFYVHLYFEVLTPRWFFPIKFKSDVYNEEML